MSKFLGEPTDVLIVKDGSGNYTDVTVADALLPSLKLIFIYFSMHDCKPCQEFTPLLEDLYQGEINEQAKVFEVIFFSGDKTPEQYKEYFAHMPWLSIPYKDPRVKAAATELKIAGVPKLFIYTRDGTLLTKDGVKEINENGPEYITELLNQS